MVILKALAIASALAFLAGVMVNACARHAPAPKAAPVVRPRPLILAPKQKQSMEQQWQAP